VWEHWAASNLDEDETPSPSRTRRDPLSDDP